MTHTRVRRLGVAATALIAVALLPATAGAHPADCTGALAEAPTTDRFADWYGCGGTATTQGTDARATTTTTKASHGKRGRFKQVGHNALFSRGMNAAIALHEDYAYVGSRTDGGHGQPHGGILVVDITKPSRPRLVGESLDPHPGESTRELRVWRSKDLLIDLNTNCGVGDQLHHCTTDSISNIRFYDISGRNAKHPKPLRKFDVDTHEFYLWVDPKDRDRALIFAGNAGNVCATRGGSPSCPFSVWDISDVPDGGMPTTLYSGTYPYQRFPAQPQPAVKPTGGLHSLTVSNDGSRAYYALLTGGFAIVDVSEFAAGETGAAPRPITINESRPVWPGPGAHSAAKLWGRDWAWVSDEVYGSATAPGHGCPWGWTRMVDISDPANPTVEAEYREPENNPSTCASWNPPRTSYSAHNPTLTPHIGFSTWHSGGMQAISVARPDAPYQLAEFLPKPLREVDLEDPRLSSDPDTGRNEKVVMWSYAVIQDGLIYVVDLRNGLYVLEYRGPYDEEVRRADYLDGNSNQGDALCYEPVGRKPRGC
jgi:hypothetical protein